MQKIHSVSVRALAEFAFERGDLIPAARAASRMRDGVRGHQALQALLPASWRPEAPVSRDIPVGERVLRVHGHIDALYVDRDIARVLEIKTTTKDPSMILKYDYPAHWAQGEIYAALVCLNEGLARAEVRLTYARLDGKKREYSDEYDAQELIERHGGKNVGSISGKTSFILAGDNMGPSKLQKAEKLGIPIVNEEDFLKMIE